MNTKTQTKCSCGLAIPAFSFRFPPALAELAEFFFAHADLIVECPGCSRVWERPLADGVLCSSVDEALKERGQS